MMIPGKDGITAVAMFEQRGGVGTSGTSRGFGVSRGTGSKHIQRPGEEAELVGTDADR